MSTTYAATATREGKWWMVSIPALDGLTQARRLTEADLMAREWISATLDIPIEDIEVEVAVERIGDLAVAAALSTIEDMRAAAAEAERDAMAGMVALAKSLAAMAVPVRDIGAALGVSFQRAHQLVHAGEDAPTAQAWIEAHKPEKRSPNKPATTKTKKKNGGSSEAGIIRAKEAEMNQHRTHRRTIPKTKAKTRY